MGEILTAENARSVRPGFDLPPRKYDKVIGQVDKDDIVFGTALSCALFE